MFRIRRIHDDLLPGDKEVIAQVQDILRSQFSLLSPDEIEQLPEQLRNPLKFKFCATLFVADDLRGNISGFAFLFHFPDLNFCFLDFISAAKWHTGRGIGGALYERVREEAVALKSLGLFLECLPDDPKLCPDPEKLKQNIARLKFYERYAAYPVIHTKYETPLKPEDDNPPNLVYDNLGHHRPLRLEAARSVVKAVLERKYGDLCPPSYIQMVVDSFRSDPIALRGPKYLKPDNPPRPLPGGIPSDKQIALVISHNYEIHHIKKRGYVESPVRLKSVAKYFPSMGLFREIPSKEFAEKYIRAVHDNQYVDYFKRVCGMLTPDASVYPYVFPIRNPSQAPRELPMRAGYYCIDSFTPLTKNAFAAAKRAADCALTAGQQLLQGVRLGYALVRPPGHHAERRVFGGFCYFNSAAVAAEYLSHFGKIAILDIDYHHGNGQQDIFFRRSDVLTLSLHGHPSTTYPYFSGFAKEVGEGEGRGYNFNFPLPENIDGDRYHDTLRRALKIIMRFKPKFLLVALGFDTGKGDPTGTWNLLSADFEKNARAIGGLRLPTLVVQEGGYNNRMLGTNARAFFLGLWSGIHSR
jgi:acetoin utilization deacetylase AcuC-like enzyme